MGGRGEDPCDGEQVSLDAWGADDDGPTCGDLGNLSVPPDDAY